MNSRRCEICRVDVHRASYIKHLRSKKHLENIKQNEMVLPEWLFHEPIENKTNKLSNPNSLRQIARGIIRLDDKQLNEELARRMINPYDFTDRNLKVGFKINLDSHHINHANSKLTIVPNHPEFGIEFRYINKIMKELANIYARLINQYKIKNQTVFSARFDKQDEDGQLLNETELFINLNINHNLTQTDLNNIDIVSTLEYQKQQLEMKVSGWRFDKINSMTVYFYKTNEINGSNYVKIPLRSNAILNVENNDKYCFFWSILASLHPYNNHPNRVSNYRQYFNELNIQDFDFTDGFKCSDVHKFNDLINLSVNIFELNFYQDQNQWEHKLTSIKISKIDSDRVIVLAIYKNHYVLIKKLDVFLGDHNKKYICRQCLSSYTSENILIKHKQKCGEDNITTMKTSNESHLYWKKHFHKNPLYFKIYADSEADNEKDNSIISNKTTNIYKQNPVLNGFHIVSELDDVLKSDYYKSPLGYDNVDWFVDEVIKLEKKMAFYFRNTKKDIIMTQEDEEDYRKNNVCRFCEKIIEPDKVRDRCHLTGKYRGPAHSKRNINVTQKQSNFYTIYIS